MVEKSPITMVTGSQLKQKYEDQKALFQAQPAIVQRFLESQALQLADSLVQRLPQARFSLPDKVVVEGHSQEEVRSSQSHQTIANSWQGV